MSTWTHPAAPDVAPAGRGVHPGDAPDALWARVFSGAPRLIVLDYDATLSRFITPRRKPRLAPALMHALRTIAAADAAALIVHSAGPIEAFRGMLHDLPAHLVGEHGWEECEPGGRRIAHALPGATQDRLERAARAAETCGWKPHLVRRRASLLLRTADLPEDRAPLLRGLCDRLWSPDFEVDGLRLHATGLGPELRAIGRSAAGAIDEAVRRMCPAPTIVRLGLTDDTARAPMAAGPAGAERLSVDVRRAGALEARFGSPGALLRLLAAWPARVAATTPLARASGAA